MQEENKIYINGKSEAISMLRLLTRKERNRILSQIKIKNPSLADELNNNCVSFRDIESLGDEILINMINNVLPEILGLAIKASSVEFQRRVLTLAPRTYAEKAYENLRLPISNSQKRIIERAQERILSTLSNHLRI